MPSQSLNRIPVFKVAPVPYKKSISSSPNIASLLNIASGKSPVEPSPAPIIGMFELSTRVISCAGLPPFICFC